ncbi:methyl coenzyme M reductase-arginine methyltransferase Mmp10 [Methanospirillum sp. J.3.6.1-F.2.7.3]|jgi:methanogenesis marker radical SAM protein|uniref:Methyl coenzyme M reductase-arginine methyltransferase Mmp10 n=1 Tax=Methanospirillum purgamenti TaxID=2834276 RepID=A0A8E7AY97_9EURY|nr:MULTISPECIES: methyl coenzyme M reductase-arginine methyltransferase Mmp10 [Methanospirillum]MDX8549622.1 methyl coenzyme M reductase-arginine methyltransferase Mmp10 [Methanospirillum hungatei]QVV89005.1 methyl coenzyme M reductase-arginine methyltransferase Mmp10 [Methanospirillum sp. J.3.6.1-F.2.7.3]
MVQLTVDIGGRPGVDCRGFCSYCYFKHAKEVPAFGCRYCLPFTKGCDYCTRSVQEKYSGFIPLRDVAEKVLADLQVLSGDLTRITISGGGDPSCYPEFSDLIELLGTLEAPLHIGYTSGKGFDNPDIADFLIENGLQEISFTVFSHKPELRRSFMNDPTPDASLEVLLRLAKEIDVYAALVILPGVNDGDELYNTIHWLEQAGVKGTILMRFANTPEQGLILNNAPIISDQPVHSIEEFSRLVRSVKKITHMRISGTPLCDPDLGSPFILLKENKLLQTLPKVTKHASIITGSIAAPYISQIIESRGGKKLVTPVKKEIADLITVDDLKGLNLHELPETIIIPGRSFVHNSEAERILSADGVQRTIIRGPDMLTADGETSMGMTRDEVLSLELEGFRTLINLINQWGA